MPTLPVDIVNRAMDECGLEEIGDLEDGSPAARAAERIYTPTLRQLFCAAHWNFARAQMPLVLIGDRTGLDHPFTDVPAPWSYMYDWPIDALHARFVPYNDSAWAAPQPFLVTSALIPNPQESEWYLTEGHDPDQTRVIVSNHLNAALVCTKLMQYPDAWDPLFEQAMVATLAARLAMPLIKDKGFARQVRADNISLARGALDAARVRDGNEGWTVQDHTPDWIRARTSGAMWGGPGVLYYSWTNMPFVEDAGAVY